MAQTPKIVACIIARLKSQRLPRKVLLDLAGKPMLLQMIERLRTSKTISKIVLCTSKHEDDKPLLEKATEWGIDAYAGDELDVLSRMIHVTDSMQADAALRCTGDNPFTDAENIDRMVKHHFETGAEYTRTNHLPLGVTAEVMGREMLHKLHKDMPDPNQSEYMSFFSFNPDLYRCEALYPEPALDRPYYSVTVDYPEDIALARSIYEKLAHKGPVPSIRDVVALLDADKSYHGVDKQSLIKKPAGERITYEQLIVELDEIADRCKKSNSSPR